MSYVERRPPRPGNNDRCPCGSGLKYKRCHREADAQAERDRAPVRFVAGGRVVGLVGEAAAAYRNASAAEKLMIAKDIATAAEENLERAKAAAASEGRELVHVPPLPTVSVGEPAPHVQVAAPAPGRVRAYAGSLLKLPARGWYRSVYELRQVYWAARVRLYQFGMFVQRLFGRRRK